MGSAHAEEPWSVGMLMAPWRSTGNPMNGTARVPRVYHEATDAELMAWSSDGDRRAFDEVVTRHGPFALRVAARLVANAAVAEDLVQEALVKAWAQASRFDPTRAKLTTWLYRIVVNLCIDYRRRATAEPLPDGYDPEDPSQGTHEIVEAAQRSEAVVRALADLPPRYRAAVSLVYDEGLSGAETARIMGISAKAVERILSRALASMRARLLPEEGR